MYVSARSLIASSRSLNFAGPSVSVDCRRQYWATFFCLRVLLDGLDLTAFCEHTNQICEFEGYLISFSRPLNIAGVQTTGGCQVPIVITPNPNDPTENVRGTDVGDYANRQDPEP